MQSSSSRHKAYLWGAAGADPENSGGDMQF